MSIHFSLKHCDLGSLQFRQDLCDLNNKILKNKGMYFEVIKPFDFMQDVYKDLHHRAHGKKQRANE